MASATPHPGAPLYRAAGGASAGLALFVGGSDNPYNYTGVGYDGVPAEPLTDAVWFAAVSDIVP